MLNFLKELHKNDQGQALVLVALAMVVLLGFSAIAIDYGYLAWQKRSLQNAADSAALAAAWELPDDSKVKSKAREYAKSNASELMDDGITATMENGNNEVKVNVEHTYNTFLGGVLGSKEQTISATATAVKEEGPWWNGLLPFGMSGGKENYPGITDQQAENIDGFSDYLKDNFLDAGIDLWMKDDDQSGHFGLIDFTDFSDGNNIKDVISQGLNQSIVGKDIKNEPGNVNAIEKANNDLSTRLERDGYSGYILAILPSVEISGRTDIYSDQYLVLYVESFALDTSVANNDAKLTGDIKGVYDISNGQIPEEGFGESSQSSRLIN